jgi:hypothetical protein
MSSEPLERSRRTRAYFIGQSVVGAAIVNALLNGVIGWLAMWELPLLPLWGAPGIAIDTALTAFGVTLGTAFVVPIQAKKDLFAGTVSPEEPSGRVGRLIHALPQDTLRRALLLGAACVAVFVPPALLGLSTFGVESMLPGPFILFKAGFSAVVAAAVTPLIALQAMVAARGQLWPGDLTH